MCRHIQLRKLFKAFILIALAMNSACAEGGDSSDGEFQEVNSSNSSIPRLSLWEENMRTYGKKHCQELMDTNRTADEHLAGTYYDAILVYSQIAQYTHDASWQSCIGAAKRIYRDQYVVANGGKVPGYWNFTEGLKVDFLSRHDQASKDALLLLATKAAFASDETSLVSTEDSLLSREVAYSALSYINAEAVGEPRRLRLAQLTDQMLKHLDQWTVSKSAPYVRPFMVALTARTLIKYQQVIGDSRILPALVIAADWLWSNTWDNEHKAFRYTDRVVESGGKEPAPDLNLLVAPLFAWLYHETGEGRFLTRSDLIFAGGVDGAFVQGAKQFNQNYIWSFDFVSWRSAPPKTSQSKAEY